MLKQHTVSSGMWELTAPVVDPGDNTTVGLRRNKSVSAVFVVGGGGKIHSKDVEEAWSESGSALRLRGEEVLQEVTFFQAGN